MCAYDAKHSIAQFKFRQPFRQIQCTPNLPAIRYLSMVVNNHDRVQLYGCYKNVELLAISCILLTYSTTFASRSQTQELPGQCSTQGRKHNYQSGGAWYNNGVRKFFYLLYPEP